MLGFFCDSLNFEATTVRLSSFVLVSLCWSQHKKKKYATFCATLRGSNSGAREKKALKQKERILKRYHSTNATVRLADVVLPPLTVRFTHFLLLHTHSLRGLQKQSKHLESHQGEPSVLYRPIRLVVSHRHLAATCNILAFFCLFVFFLFFPHPG